MQFEVILGSKDKEVAYLYVKMNKKLVWIHLVYDDDCLNYNVLSAFFQLFRPVH